MATRSPLRWSRWLLFAAAVVLAHARPAAADPRASRSVTWPCPQPFDAYLEGGALAQPSTDARGIIDLMASAHAGMTAGAFDRTLQHWLARARHPAARRGDAQTVYPTMLQLLDGARAPALTGARGRTSARLAGPRSARPTRR